MNCSPDAWPRWGIDRDGIYGRVNWIACDSLLLAIALEIPFMNTTLYVSPVANALDSVDLAWIVGLLVPALSYYWLMKDIYLLIEHGIDQGEVYVLGYFDDERKAKDVAEEEEWEAYRASLKAEHVWSSHKPLAPDKTAYRRFWIKAVSRLERMPVPRSSAVH